MKIARINYRKIINSLSLIRLRLAKRFPSATLELCQRSYASQRVIELEVIRVEKVNNN